jgi:putative ABC transport system permease protein
MEEALLSSLERYRARRGRLAVPIGWLKAFCDTVAQSVSLRFAPSEWSGAESHRVAGASGGKVAGLVRVLWYGCRLAARRLRRSPLFTAAAVVTLALGISASTVMFNLVHTVLIRPLDYPESDRLVTVFRLKPELTGMDPSVSRIQSLYAVPLSLYRDWEELSPAFESSGAYASYTFTHRAGESMTRIRGAVVTSGFFRALGVQPAIGRWLLPQDDEVGAPGQALLSHGLWMRMFGGDPEVLGSRITLNDTPHTVVGIMPPGFHYPVGRSSIWVTFEDPRKRDMARQSGNLQVIARLAGEITPQQAQLEMNRVANRLGERYPEEADHGVLVVPLKELLVVNARAGLWLLFGAVGLVLLISCANIANLL